MVPGLKERDCVVAVGTDRSGLGRVLLGMAW